MVSGLERWRIQKFRVSLGIQQDPHLQEDRTFFLHEVCPQPRNKIQSVFLKFRYMQKVCDFITLITVLRGHRL